MADLKRPKKPKKKKYPKAPKAGASMEVQKRYHDRVAEVKKENDKKMSDYNKKLKAFETQQTQKKKLREKAAKMKSS